MTALHTLKRGLPLAINAIHKAFGEREVLKDIQLNIPAGQFVAVVGRSGCGKSTCCACWRASTYRPREICMPAMRRLQHHAKTSALCFRTHACCPGSG